LSSGKVLNSNISFDAVFCAWVVELHSTKCGLRVRVFIMGCYGHGFTRCLFRLQGLKTTIVTFEKIAPLPVDLTCVELHAEHHDGCSLSSALRSWFDCRPDPDFRHAVRVIVAIMKAKGLATVKGQKVGDNFKAVSWVLVSLAALSQRAHNEAMLRGTTVPVANYVYHILRFVKDFPWHSHAICLALNGYAQTELRSECDWGRHGGQADSGRPMILVKEGIGGTWKNYLHRVSSQKFESTMTEINAMLKDFENNGFQATLEEVTRKSQERWKKVVPAPPSPGKAFNPHSPGLLQDITKLIMPTPATGAQPTKDPRQICIVF